MRSLSLALTLIIFSFSAATADVATASRDKAASNRSDTKPPQIEVCFVLDTTGSMGGLIQGAKDKIWSIATEMIQADPKPQIRFGLIGYRDRGDDYVTKRFDLTEDIDSIYGKLTAFKAAGGGDGPESVNQALSESVRTMDWTENSDVLKIIFLVGDAPPHMDYDEVKYPKTCRKAKKKQLIINTIQCGQMAGTAEVWQSIAQSAGGEYAAILQSGGTVALHTPHDRRIADLNMQLNATICVYGSAKEQRAADVKIQAQAVA
ncbi:MAG: vWA domain-containing protein, partial [Planctomycetota bacterium]